MPPYDELVSRFKKSGDITDLIEYIGLDPVQNALHAAERVNGTAKLADFVAMLERAKNNYLASEQLSKMSQKLRVGEDVDWSTLTAIAHRAQAGIGNGFTPMSKVVPMEIPFKKTGFTAIDKHFGGLPSTGQVLVGASPGTGKTTFMAELAACWVKTYPKEFVVIYTLEMLKEELRMRLDQVADSMTSEELDRILVEDMPMTPEETISKLATVDNVGLCCVDFADLLIQGETTESAMAHIYRTYMMGAKTVGIPIVVLAQFSGNYQGGIPRPNHIRWTRLAEALAWGIIMLYNPNSSWFSESDDDEILPQVKGRAYIIGWKFRGGFREHLDDSPGAIQVRFSGKDGWDTLSEGKWYPIKETSPKKVTHSMRGY